MEKCPNCSSSNIYIWESRKQGNHVIRRRKCIDCKKNFKTIEILYSEYQEMEQAKEELIQIKNILKERI